MARPLPAGAAPVIAQSVYHAAFDGRAEESLVHASSAYIRAEELRLRPEPGFSDIA